MNNQRLSLLTLADVGEMRLLDEVLLPLAREFDPTTRTGDDCAFVRVGPHVLAATADVGPRPVIHQLAAHRDDWEAAGWLAVVATASDVASAGAKPLFLTNCIDAPAALSVGTLAAFLRGYFRAMAEFGFHNGGGDLRQGPSLLARVFGVGVVEHGRLIGRGGAAPGDHLVVVGSCGVFMAHFLLALQAEEAGVGAQSPDTSPDKLRFPRPPLAAMQLLAANGLVTAASDTSDGLLGAIDNVARASHCGFTLQLRNAMLSAEVCLAAQRGGALSPWNVFFAWGDWSVAAVVPAGRLTDFGDVCAAHAVEWCALGTATESPGLYSHFGGDPRRHEMAVVRNENFVSRGFNSHLANHLNFILRTPLFKDQEF